MKARLSRVLSFEGSPAFPQSAPVFPLANIAYTPSYAEMDFSPVENTLPVENL
jgi:hypothetical protein